MIGNSRLHWALFQGGSFLQAWDTPHLTADQVQTLIDQQFAASAWVKPWPQNLDEVFPIGPDPLPLWLAFVVPSQADLWNRYSARHDVHPHQLPISGLYPTLGSDRILALWGAGQTWGWPVLVIDGGTALTLTAATCDRHFLGGAILPGLGLQFRSLAQQTAALPAVHLPTALPPRWATDTTTAIHSGIIYTVLAGLQDYLQDWWQRYPDGAVVLTGGDGESLRTYLQAQGSAIASRLQVAPHLIFWGIRAYRDWSHC